MYHLMKAASRQRLSGLALHITARSLGTSNPKPPLADEYSASQVSPSGWRGSQTPILSSRTLPANH